MARQIIADHLQNHRFHLLDVGWGLTIPPFVFNPVGAFSAITAPEFSLETDELQEGNYWFKRHVITGGSISNITLTRGALYWDAEFWNWMSEAVRGSIGGLLPPRLGGHRRNLLLIQYMAYGAHQNNGDPGGATIAVLAELAQAISLGSVTRLPARAWMLFGCLPIRYKAAGDFDGTSADVSMMELEFTVERAEEFGIAAI